MLSAVCPGHLPYGNLAPRQNLSQIMMSVGSSFRRCRDPSLLCEALCDEIFTVDVLIPREGSNRQGSSRLRWQSKINGLRREDLLCEAVCDGTVDN